MLLFKRATPAVGSVLTGLSVAAIAWKPLFLPVWLVVFMLVSAGASAFLCGFTQDWRQWWRVVCTPFVCAMGWGLAAAFVESPWVLFGMAVLAAASMWWYLEQLFTFLHLPGAYRPYGLDRAAFLLEAFGMVGWGIGLFSLHVFMREYVALWGALLAWGIVVLLLTDAALWLGKVEETLRRLYTWWSAVMLMGIFFAYAWLPVHVFVQGMSVAVWWVAMVSAYRANAMQRLSGPAIRNIVVGAGIALVALLVTAKWV